MPLVTYKDARPWAKSIATRVANGTMPPWHADPSHGQFLNDRSLNGRRSRGAPEVGQLGRAGRESRGPAGSCRRSPKAGRWASPTRSSPCRRTIPSLPSGTIDYKYFEVPTNLTEDKWVQAIEVRPGDSRRRASRDRVHARRAPSRVRPHGRTRRPASHAAVLVWTGHAASRRRAEAGQGAESTTIARRSAIPARGSPDMRPGNRFASISRARR